MKKGFTLMELLIVVLVIAILTAIAIPSYMVTVEKGKATEVVKLTRDIYDAVERYNFRTGGLPTMFDDLDIELRGLSNKNLTFTNEFGTFTIDGSGNVKGVRSSSGNFGTYYFIINRTSDEGVMYCYAQSGTDAVKVCAGLSSSDDAAPSGESGYLGYKM
jgi:prepilin-type N-terminal cleavage/methylation domain-containing protein